MQRLSDALYCFEDTCRVYVVLSGLEAVLVDFGSGVVLDELPTLGVERVQAVLMTHHHRDQGQGLARAVAAGIPIFVPHTEQDLFRSVDAHWQAREVLNSYNNRQDRFSLLEPVPIAGTLKDYATYRFGDLAFAVLPTPGHTTGSLTLLAELDDRRVAFTGDLIAAPGKVWSLAATQWSYNGAEGVAASVASLLELKDRRPHLLLPAHGEAMPEPALAINLVVERLWELLQQRRENPRLFQLREEPYVALTPHLLWNRTSLAYGYVLVSKNHKALLLDFGYDFMTGAAAGSDRASRRPWLYTLPVLKRLFGVETIDVALPTHYHDDHLAGFNLLREAEGTRVWAAENFADILEQPTHYNLPCLWYDPIKVDRVLPVEVPFRWEEHTLTLYPQPGHTTHAVAVALEVDGLRVLFSGDQYQNATGWNYVYNNGFHLDDYRKSAELYRRLQPDLVLSGHWEPYRVEPGYFDRLDEQGEILSRLHRELLPSERADTGGDGLVTLRPYGLELAVGEKGRLEVAVRNPRAQAETATVTLVVPQGWRVEPEFTSSRLEAGGEACLSFSLLPAPQPVRRARVAAEVSFGDERSGQAAEALVTVTDKKGV